MKTSVCTLLVTLLGSSMVPLVATVSAPPVPGPGGVAAAVQAFLRCQDQGSDPGALLTERSYGLDFAIAADGSLIETKATAPAFLDVGADGVPVEAVEPQAFAKQLAAGVATDGKAGRTLTSDVRTIRANCESARCSVAVVDFDRVYTVGGVTQRVPMRATALLQFEHTDAGDFRICHWHASRAAERPIGKADAKQVR